MNRVHLLISGDVTGVGFRLSTIYIARDLGLTGWVRNTEDPSTGFGRELSRTGSGKVEIVAEGEKGKLKNLVIWAHKGPPTARVENVEVEWQKATGEFRGFEVLR